MKLIPPNITAGPWTSKEVSEGYSIRGNCFRIAQGESNMPVTLAPIGPHDPGGDSRAKGIANAKAIAAIPDLLKALTVIEEFSEEEGSPFALSVAATAKAALLKAGYTIAP